MKQTLALLALAALAVAGCATPGAGPAPSARAAHGAQPTAVATLAPTAGNATSGTVRFVQNGGRVLVSGEVRGLRPNSEHGFHVHEKGDCSSPDATSAGGHYNPSGRPHARHDAAAHHAGDLPSLKADASGVARFSFASDAISVGPGAADVVGKGLIVHRDPDDYATQPTGNSGPRLACAVIRPS